jgi:hypothetical protein
VIRSGDDNHDPPKIGRKTDPALLILLLPVVVAFVLYIFDIR